MLIEVLMQMNAINSEEKEAPNMAKFSEERSGIF